jgi:hypothetical protein
MVLEEHKNLLSTLTNLNTTRIIKNKMSQTKAQLLNPTGTVTFEGINVSGVTTVSNIDASSLNVSGVTTVSNIDASSLNVSGVTTVSNIDASSLNVSGVATVTNVNTSGLNVSGVTTVSNIDASSLNVSGVTTVSGLNNSGVTSTSSLFVENSVYNAISTTSISKTLVNREFCEVVTSGLTITLPASPSSGWEVSVNVGNFTDTIIGRNGSNIMSLAEDLTLDVAYRQVDFVYVNSTVGWRIG